MRTRLAPSPTGALHLGNARTFLVNWALARQRGWEIVLRIEDLDGPRVKPGSIEQTLELLQWLGLDWDEGPYYQLHDLSPYETALAQLAGQGDIYACACTRREIEAASLSAPHAGDHELRYPGTCRPAEAGSASVSFDDGAYAWRLRVPEGETTFVDTFAGEQSHNVQQTVGDFLVRTKTKLASYQLAVVVDDARQNIDQVVRGDDLIPSTPRQLLLYDRLQLPAVPTYTHLPLVVGEDGRRLAKRHGDSRLLHYHEQGVRAERILGLLAEWCGLELRQELTSAEFVDCFDLEKMPKQPQIFRKTDNAWLLGG
ncbi:MAG: tRNA glutamyl-Q(34) synthetase GluQRS [Pirellulales bacterium]|nr:tRNA glutamyl-Q(34) synthetase GluQRS [Pirellulales bacterium]